MSSPPPPSSSPPATTLAIVIVSWNVRDLLRQCLRAVEASLAGCGGRYEIVVVDNASSDGTPAMLREEFPRVHLREAGGNLGFAAGNNLALRDLGLVSVSQPAHSSSSLPCPDMVLLLNPDTEPVGDALPRLVRSLEQHPDAAVVGPQLRYADGRVQSSRRRFPTRLTLFWESTLLERLWPANPWARSYRCTGPRDPDDTTWQRVDWLVGAALLVRGAAIARAGGLDERFFLYSEEVEWQYRLRGSGPHQQSIIYDPAAVVVHHEGGSSGQVPAVLHIHFQRSKIRLAQMWYGPRIAALLRGFLLLGYLWELLSEGGKHLVGHRRPLRRGRIRAYAELLHSGL
jgi:GT2 family glycosyltransferase